MTVKCRLCLQPHEAEYQIQRNGNKHMVYRCPNKKKERERLKAVEYLPMIEDPSIKSYTIEDKNAADQKLKESNIKANENLPIPGQTSLF